MKKLFLLVALTGAAVAAYCVTPANASTTEALQAKADVYKMSSNLVILPEYGASETVYILKNGWEVSRDTDCRSMPNHSISTCSHPNRIAITLINLPTTR